MDFESFRDNFTTVVINKQIPSHWTSVRFEASWTKFNSVGLPNNKYQFEAYAENPQFLLKPNKDTELFFTLTQDGGRLPKIKDKSRPHEKTYFKYPYEETLNYANVCVFELNYKEPDYLEAFDRKKLKFCTPVKRERGFSGLVKLWQQHSYIIVPSTEQSGKTGDFSLSLWFDSSLKDIEIRRVTKHGSSLQPNDQILPTFAREFIHNKYPMPSWKLQVVSQSLKFMIRQFDDHESFSEESRSDLD